MSTLTIEHTDVEGTLLHGTSRGDRSAEVVKGLRWRWGRSIGCWYVPRSRDVPPKRALIARTAAALEEAGFTVAVSIEAAVAEQDEAEQRRGERADARAERLQERAERHGAAAQQRWNASRELADRIPFGQPFWSGTTASGGRNVMPSGSAGIWMPAWSCSAKPIGRPPRRRLPRPTPGHDTIR